MIRARRTTLLAAIVIGIVPAAVLVAGCGSSDSSSSTATFTATVPANSISIAAEGPLTGDQASNGQDMLNGVQLAADQINT